MKMHPKRLTKVELMAEQNAKLRVLLVAVDEILPPEKQKRLRELAIQIEVYYLGYATALTWGRLSDSVLIHDNQKTSLDQKLVKLREQMDQEMNSVAKKYQDLVLKELTTEQSKAAQERLGAPFIYRTPPNRSYRK